MRQTVSVWSPSPFPASSGPFFSGSRAGDLADAGVVDQALRRGQDACGTPLQPAVDLVEILREASGRVPLPVDAVEDAEGLRRVALDGEDGLGTAALRDAPRGAAHRVKRVEGDHLAADVAAPEEVLRGRQFAALAVAVGAPDALAVGGARPGEGKPGPGPAADHVLQRLGVDRLDDPVEGGLRDRLATPPRHAPTAANASRDSARANCAAARQPFMFALSASTSAGSGRGSESSGVTKISFGLPWGSV